jgi:hypothetical protein
MVTGVSLDGLYGTHRLLQPMVTDTGSVRKAMIRQLPTLSLRNDAQQCDGPTGHQHQGTEQAAWNFLRTREKIADG